MLTKLFFSATVALNGLCTRTFYELVILEGRKKKSTDVAVTFPIVLIAYRIWYHQRKMTRAMSGARGPTSLNHVAVIVVESGKSSSLIIEKSTQDSDDR